MPESSGLELDTRVLHEGATGEDLIVGTQLVDDQTELDGHSATKLLRDPRRLVAAALVAVAMMRIGAVDLGGVVSNDSLFYLRRAEAPFGAGFVVQGYRQAAYPLFIAISNVLGDLLGWDHVFGVALLQRSILIVAVVAAMWALRWWSIPVVAIATSETFVVHTDMLLPEGFLVPSCLLAAAVAAGVTVGRVKRPRTAHGVLVALALIAAACASIKLQYSLLTALVVTCGVLLVRDGLISKQFARSVVAVLAGSLACLGMVQAFENRSELDVFEPVSERARAEWYGAWTAVFKVHPDNATVPELAEFYDGGDLYVFLHGIEADITDYPTRAAIIRDRVDAMFDAAGTSARREQVNAFIGGLGAGRLDDLRSIITPVLAARGDADLRIFFNRVGRSDGVQAVVDGYNDGAWPGMASFGPLLDPVQIVLDDHSPLKKPVAWVSIAVMLLSLLVGGRHRWFVGAALLVVFGAAGLMASGYIDNARYLLGPFAVGVIGGTVGLRSLIASPTLRSVLGRIR